MIQDSIKELIIQAIQGRSGEVRIDCPNCTGSQKKTLAINADTGLFCCHRCDIKGNAKYQHTHKKPFAEWVWDHAIPCKTHPYLELKKIKAHGLRTNSFNGKQQLIVPYTSYNQITTAQTINEDGSKKFLPKKKGCEAKGSSHIIGKDFDNDGPVYICEGFATAASIHEATGKIAVSVAMKSNFEPSFEQIRHKFNGAEITFCADNDQNGGGLLYAARAAKKYNAKLVMPEHVGHDFNDVWVEGGADAVNAQLKKYIDPSQVDTDKKDSLTDLEVAGITFDDILTAAYAGQNGCSDIYVDRFKNIHAHDRAANQWYQFTGDYWEVDKLGLPIRDCDIIQDFYKHAAASIDTEDPKLSEDDKKEKETQKKTINKIVFQLNNLFYRKQVIDFATHGENSLGITGEEWDCLPWMLAVKNGIIDLKTGVLRHGKPEDYIKSYCPTEYDKKATCPNFEKFLLEILDGDTDLYSFLQSLLGAGLIGNGSFKQYVAIFSGVGRNGKDTLMGIIQHVLGLSVAASIPTELILDGGPGGKRSSQGPSADLMKLRGLRLAYVNETSQGRKFNTGQVKQLSGGGLMTAREPYGKRNIDWEQTHMLFLMTNSKPQAPVDDYAFWKRIKTIHFPLSFVSDPKEKHERQADIHLGENLKKEAPGILNFLIEGCLEYQKNGLIEPAAVKAANLQYLKDVDQTGLFIDECCSVAVNAKTTAKALYADYKTWAQENNLRPVSGTAFGRYVSSRFEKKTDGRKGVIYYGIGILNEEIEGNENPF